MKKPRQYQSLRRAKAIRNAARISAARNHQSSKRRNFFSRHLDPWHNIRATSKSYNNFAYEIRFRGIRKFGECRYSPFDTIVASIRSSVGHYKIAYSVSRKNIRYVSMRVYLTNELDLMLLRLCEADPEIIYRLKPVSDQEKLH